MILEIAQINVKPGMEAEFEQGAAKAIPYFKRAKGCQSLELRKVVEIQGFYHLMIEWETIDDHMVTFRNSEDFQKWRECVAHCFSVPPVVIHSTEAVNGF